MGNPVSTRLGINQFWYKHWYSDTNRKLNFKQDSVLESFIILYLQYGTLYQSNPFLHEYWYKKNVKYTRVVLHSKTNAKAFRRFFYTNDTLAIEHSYLIRNKTPEYFPMRMWVFKYDNWIINCVNWFKPLKIKIRRKSTYRTTSYSASFAIASPRKKLVKRLKILLTFMNTRNVYSF